MGDQEDWIIDSNGLYVATPLILDTVGLLLHASVPSLPVYQLTRLSNIGTTASRGHSLC